MGGLNSENKKKIFKDATQGYIQIPSHMVKYLIDSFEMQRLKDVAQTGIRPIYSGATHDRFSHSVGVYNIGTQIYESFCKNLLADYGDGTQRTRLEDLLRRYATYYHTACMLHDIGHPALSHTFEYIYDNKYLCLDNAPTFADKNELRRLYDVFSGATPKKPLQTALREALLHDSTYPIEAESIHGSQHEMMGAYQILRANPSIHASIKDYFRASMPGEREVDYAFIACMIIGAQYRLPPVGAARNPETIMNRLDLSLRNCIIQLLNGLIDADSIDYLNRNAHFAGYSTAELDVVRLCNAFSAHYDPKALLFEPCMEKSAMSVLEGFVSARNFEPKWLYSHHKIIYYEEFLVKYLYKKCARYLYAQDKEKWDKLIKEVFLENPAVKKTLLTPYAKESLTLQPSEWQEYIAAFSTAYQGRGGDPSSLPRFPYLPIPPSIYPYFARALHNETQRIESGEGDLRACCERVVEISALAQHWLTFSGDIRQAYYGYLLSPVGKYLGFGRCYSWFKTSDSDINAAFKQLYLHYKDIPWEQLSPEEKEANDRYELFQSVLKEYLTRQYRQSLWKTEQEYHIFLTDIEKRTGLSSQVINKRFIDFITDNGYREEFDDLDSFSSKDRRNYRAVYLNREPGALSGVKDQKFNDVFGFLGLGMVICIYRFHYKDFSRLKIRFQTSSGARLLSYGKLTGDGKRADEYLPYIYYTRDDGAFEELGDAEYADMLRKKLADHLINSLSSQQKGEPMQSNKRIAEKGKLIRDPVHGDILIPERFLKVVDSKAFQRLRRIKQLATADYVFPEASHTRFAHSIGTFHIMSLMMDRICSLFDYLHIPYVQQDRDVILMSALLHDIGHGPYSHAFEELSEGQKSHEQWTREIIEQDAELKEILETNFDADFAAKVVDCLQKNAQSAEFATLQNVFSSLISSQLDADRLDYLLRDSYNTGIKLGIVDLQKIIASLGLTQYNGKLSVCVAEDALSSVEQLIVGRFNMYDTVYFSPYKAFSEQLLADIVKRISRDSKLQPECLFYKIRSGSLTLAEYLRLDDSAFQSAIYQYQQSCEDPITKEMIDSFFNRRGYERLRIMDESVGANDAFIQEFQKECNVRADDLFGLVYRVESYSAYNCSGKDAILIAGKNGVISDLAEKSKIIGRVEPLDGVDTGGRFWETSRSCVYMNEHILQQETGQDGKPINMEKVRKLIDAYSLRKHTEIEEKYSCTAEAIERGSHTEELFASGSMAPYEIREKKTKQQEDCYFDTDDYFLAERECSFRRRMLNGKYIFTIKKSIDPNNRANGGQFIRSEFELETECPDLNKEVMAFADKHLRELFRQGGYDLSAETLQPKITVKNDRISYLAARRDSEFQCEVSLDSVEYFHDGKSSPDWQIEIELKSQDPIHRVELKDFADKLRQELGVKSEMRETLSKYEKALRILGIQQ